MFRSHLLSLSPLLLTVITFIILSISPTATSDPVHPTIATSIEEANKWMYASKSREQQRESGVCNVSPSLGYLRSHLKQFLKTIPSRQPLAYSFYLKNVLQPYRSHLAEADAPSTSFCDLNRYSCKPKPNETDCDPQPDFSVCLPNSDATTEGTCVACSNLGTAIQAGGSVKNESSIRDLKATCHPVSSRGPKPAPQRKTKDDVRWLRWFLESSYVFEGKKVGDGCSANPELSKARAYVNILMKAHFGPRKEDANVSLATPGKEDEEDERRYKAAKEEMADEKGRRKWWEEKLWGIKEREDLFAEVYCSREKGLVCMEGKWECVMCGDEDVKGDQELNEACSPEEEGHLKKGSSGTQGGQQIQEFAAVILGLLASTLFGNFRW
jgi:hypothetical protein